MTQRAIPTVCGTLHPVRTPSGRLTHYIVKILCSYCGKTHTRGAGKEGRDLGHRISHCDENTQNPGYIIVCDEEGQNAA